jgi:hypothetical protein
VLLERKEKRELRKVERTKRKQKKEVVIKNGGKKVLDIEKKEVSDRLTRLAIIIQNRRKRARKLKFKSKRLCAKEERAPIKSGIR